MVSSRAEPSSDPKNRKIPEKPPGSSAAGAVPEAGPVPAPPPPLSLKLGCAPQSRSVHLLCPCLHAGKKSAGTAPAGQPLKWGQTPFLKSASLWVLGALKGVEKSEAGLYDSSH